MAAWAFIDFCLLAAGGLALALSIVWRAPDVLRNIIVTDNFLTLGMILGICLLVTFVLSIGAIVQRNHVTIGLVILNWVLVLDAIVVLVVGSVIWFFTLEGRAHFLDRFLAASESSRIVIQDQFQCCGYTFSNDSSVAIGGFCSSTEFAASLQNGTQSCIGPLSGHADYTLNQIFSTIYGMMSIVLALLLASLCVIKKRNEDERFKKIDAKRGGRGFV